MSAVMYLLFRERYRDSATPEKDCRHLGLWPSPADAMAHIQDKYPGLTLEWTPCMAASGPYAYFVSVPDNNEDDYWIEPVPVGPTVTEEV